MSKMEIVVDRASVENFTRNFLRSGNQSLKGKCTKDWMNKSFKADPAPISLHAWKTFLTIFAYEHEDELKPSWQEFVDVSMKWFMDKFHSASSESAAHL